MQYALNGAASIGSKRYEYFTTENEALFGQGTINAVMISGNFKAGDLTFIREFRIDSSSSDDLLDSDKLSADTVIQIFMAAVYCF